MDQARPTRAAAGKIRRHVRRGALLGAGLLLLGAAGGYGFYLSQPPFEVFHGPGRFPRRAECFSANVTGGFLPLESVRYRLNDMPWRDIARNPPRTMKRQFTIELPKRDLRLGDNRLTIESSSPIRASHRWSTTFVYDDSPVELPVVVDWKDRELEAQDGRWETVEVDGEWRVRPKPGYEGYDRMLVVTGAFAGGRRVTTHVVFRDAMVPDYGFGVLSMWAGHPDDLDFTLRRGWDFALSWYWHRHFGYGNEISYKFGAQRERWVQSYRNYEMKPGVRHHVIAEVFPEVDAEGRHIRHRHRTKWWPDGEKEPDTWIDLEDDQGAALEPKEYCVALLAFWTQVEYGPVRVEALPPVRAGER